MVEPCRPAQEAPCFTAGGYGSYGIILAFLLHIKLTIVDGCSNDSNWFIYLLFFFIYSLFV